MIEVKYGRFESGWYVEDVPLSVVVREVEEAFPDPAMANRVMRLFHEQGFVQLPNTYFKVLHYDG